MMRDVYIDPQYQTIPSFHSPMVETDHRVASILHKAEQDFYKRKKDTEQQLEHDRRRQMLVEQQAKERAEYERKVEFMQALEREEQEKANRGIKIV